MTDTEIDRIKKLAEAATPGPYEVWSSPFAKGEMHRVAAKGVAFLHCQQWPIGAKAERSYAKPNAEYMAALDPQTILAILAENQRLRDALQELVACDDAGLRAQAEFHLSDNLGDPALELWKQTQDRFKLAWSAARAALSGEAT